MKGDFSRRTHDPRKHYSAVLQEQGRLLTDADLEEEHRILSGRHETTAADLIGGCGGPVGGAGFAVSSPDGLNLALSAGRYYASGTLLSNEAAINYTDQPDRFSADIAWPPAPGRYAIVLDAWRRLITALDDPSIREVALGGPTTSVREKAVWQVRHVAVNAAWDCAEPLPAGPETTGAMAARAVPEAALTTPCLVPPLAGYTGLENQLYRVEVLTPGGAVNLANAAVIAIVSIPAGSTNQVVVSAQAAATLNPGDIVEIIRTGAGSDPLDATFAQVASKAGATITLTSRTPEFAPGEAPALRRAAASVVISRENGSVVTAIERIDGREITVRDLGPDDVLGFSPGQWVELSDDRVELEHRPRQLRQIEAIDTVRMAVTLRTPATALAGTPDGVAPERHPKLRRWDAARAIVFRANGSGWIHLENGIQVRFAPGQYVSGDYWRFPARAAIVDAASGNIEWLQQSGGPALLPPVGIVHHLCPIAVVDVTQDATGAIHATVTGDCRNLFPPVTELTSLLYVGGDGQETSPGGGAFPPLPAPLTVRVANGSHPVPGARVEFRLTQGNGQLNGAPASAIVATNADGLASCSWALDGNTPAQTCEAHLLSPGGAAIAHQAVRFHAILDRDEGGGSRCCCVSVGPGGDFETIEEAIDGLLARGERNICLCLIPGDHGVGRIELKTQEKRGFHLSITGCGRGTRVGVKGGILVDHWASVRLEDFDLVLDPETFVQTLGVSEVTLQGMLVRGAPPKVGLVRIHAASRVHVGDCVLEAAHREDRGRLKNFFSGIGPLESLWDAPDEAEFATIVRRSAAELEGLGAGARRTLVRTLDRKVADQGRELSAGLAARVSRLSAAITAKREGAAVAEAINDLRAAAARQSDLVALEIGAPDDLQERMADPSTVTPAMIVIENNDIAGNISLYGVAGGRPLNVDERTLLERRIKGVQLGGQAGAVHLRDNRFGRLLLSGGMVEALRQLALGQIEALLSLFESLHMTNNVIDNSNGQLAALHAVLTSNDFTLAALPSPSTPPVVLDLIADTAIYTGNHGATVAAVGAVAQPAVIEQTVRASAEVGNLELRIQ